MWLRNQLFEVCTLHVGAQLLNLLSLHFRFITFMAALTILCKFLFSLAIFFHVQKSMAPSKKDPAQEFLAMYSHSPPSVAYGEQSPKKTVVDLKRKIQDLKKENDKLKELLVEGITSYH